ncbi:MAG: hypothetical protein HFH28_11910, partial [Clostridiaceae bacterium]|nr:hypothetical protein [Clostridiaceae bacterium]
MKTLDYGYDNNTYLSLRDIAIALTNTEKAFSLDITNNTVSLNLGADYVPVGTENAPWGEEELPDSSLRRNECKVNGETVFYYTLIMLLPEGYYDCFMMAADLAMILDVNLTFPAEDTLQIFTQESFEISPVFLEQTGYFCGVNSVLAGAAPSAPPGPC